ncbi:MAG: Phosphoglucomutase [Chlamydiae bacterium]|nr:Phosphoglucomutase [Chlamydiota bacterium]
MMPKEIEDRIAEWESGPIDQVSKAEIQTLRRDDPDKLMDAFYSTLSFGTGGMRGIMGVGSTRMNIYTIQMATQGLANYLLLLQPKRDRHYVFIGYDCRNHSYEFAMQAARVLAGNGIGVYLTFELRPTPYVSFGVRQKECSAGIMITASHNSKEYNGYKVYWSDGAQVVAPHDKGIVEEAQKITKFDQIHLSVEKSPLIEIINPEFDFEYLEAIKKLQIDKEQDQKVGDQLKITYTSLHGTGIKLVPRALRTFGFTNINLVDHQIVPDGNFPTVTHPNPEYAEALAMGINQLVDTSSDIFIATDPDADRMAVVALHRDKSFTLSGNQIAILCLEYICRTLQAQEKLPANGAAITTIVSTDLLSVIAKNYNIACFEVLTGFKYIGELIHKWEQDQSHQFLFGAEESYGYLMGTHSRDKDAIIASCLVAEIALLMKVEGRTLVDFLEEIYKKYGLFYEQQKVLEFPPGHEGMKKMQQMMQLLRTASPKKIMGQDVTTIEDYQSGLHGLPPSNVLLYRLADKSKIVVRPSGTEPKLKIYAAVQEPTFENLDAGIATCQEKLQNLFNAVETLF